MSMPQPAPEHRGTPPPQDMDPAIFEAMKRLINDEANGARLDLTIGPYAAFVALGALQLAWRNPNMNGPTAEIIRGIGAQLQAMFAHDPVLSALLAKGWNRKHDAEHEPGGQNGAPQAHLN